MTSTSKFCSNRPTICIHNVRWYNHSHEFLFLLVSANHSSITWSQSVYTLYIKTNCQVSSFHCFLVICEHHVDDFCNMDNNTSLKNIIYNFALLLPMWSSHWFYDNMWVALFTDFLQIATTTFLQTNIKLFNNSHFVVDC